jgi:hypothetical protein
MRRFGESSFSTLENQSFDRLLGFVRLDEVIGRGEVIEEMFPGRVRSGTSL